MQFSITHPTEQIISAMQEHNIWQKACPVPVSDLRVVKITYYDFSLKLSYGEIMVHHKLAEATLRIFESLFELKFPINSVKLINDFRGDDNLSMEANNSSSFNYREIVGGTGLSMHAYGAAIDINPVQNPYMFFDEHQQQVILPETGKKYMDRTLDHPAMVESIIPIFQDNLFSEWGGNWQSCKDYHHFQIPRDKIDWLLR